MSIGYGYYTREDNFKADQQLLGVKLGRTCIKMDIPVAHIHTFFGVSRQTVYNWFAGKYEPSKHIQEQIKGFIADQKFADSKG